MKSVLHQSGPCHDNPLNDSLIHSLMCRVLVTETFKLLYIYACKGLLSIFLFKCIYIYLHFKLKLISIQVNLLLHRKVSSNKINWTSAGGENK